MAGEQKKISNILVFELNWMGDILFSFPLLRALNKAFPEARITCAVVSGYAELLSDNPWVDSVIELSGKRGIGSVPENISFLFKARKQRFDVCLFLKPSRTKAMLAVLAGIKERIGFSSNKGLLTASVEVPGRQVHRADQILSLARALGIGKADGTYEYFISAADKQRAENIMVSSGSLKKTRVALNPGGNWGPKRWPEEYFTELARKILERFENIEIVMTGSPKDERIAGKIVSEINSERCYSVAGKTRINELAAVFASSAITVSADSGPLHLASASGCSTIGLFGPTSPEITGQRGRQLNVIIKKHVDCAIPCYIDNCEKNRECMLSITPDDVLAAVERILEKEN